MSAEGYSVDPNHSDSIRNDAVKFKEAYTWLYGKAVERGLVDTGRGMIWAWYRFGKEGRRKPDVRTLRRMNTSGKKMCCMTLEVPDDKVLLMDTNQWSLRLTGSSCITAEEEAMDVEEFVKRQDELYAMPEADRLRYNESTWDLVFDTSRATSIEAVFFGLDRSMVKAVQFFTGECMPQW
jgi:hypothetical protein